MITIPRSVARSCRAVFRRLLTGRTPRGRPAAVGLSCGPGGLRVRCAAAEAAAEYHHPSPGEDARLAVPLDALAACEGRRGDALFRRLEGGRVEVVSSEGGASSARPFACDGLEAPPFPDWPESEAANDAQLLIALDRAMNSAAKEGTRYALHRALLCGKRGDVVATDGRQLLVQSGFDFPWTDDVLIPRSSVFGCREFIGNGEVLLGRTQTLVVLKCGPWTLLLSIDSNSRYPDAQAVIPRTVSIVARLVLDDQDAAFLTSVLPKLPGVRDFNAPVTLDLGRPPAVRARAEGSEQVTEVPLARSTTSGPALRLHIDRRLLHRSIVLGFRELQIVSADAPVVLRDDRRLYLWVPFDKKNALPPGADVIRVDPTDGAAPTPSPPSPGDRSPTCRRRTTARRPKPAASASRSWTSGTSRMSLPRRSRCAWCCRTPTPAPSACWPR